MILESKKKDFIEVLLINKEINLFIKYLRKTLKLEQKHSIILVENLQKNLLLDHYLDPKIIDTLTKAFNNLPYEQKLNINEKFNLLKNL